MKLRQRAVVTDPGRRRRRNEDAYVVQPPLFAVADGMGGAQAGEVASELAVKEFEGGIPDGSDPRELATPQGGSDPDWSGVAE